MIALLACFLFPVQVSIREDGFLHLNRGTFFVLAAFFLTGMAQASGMGDPALGAAQGLFQEGWGKHYSGMIDWIGDDFGGGNVSVDPGAMTVTIDGEVTKVDVCNVIPAMKAGRIAELAGVTDGKFAPVNAIDMSTKADADVYVLGDASQQGDMPKSGFSANSQAKVCANAVRGALTGSRVFPAKFSNTCWSLIDTNDGVKVGATYEATDEKIAKVDGFISATGETAEVRKATYEESEGWYAGITADMFG